MWRAVIVRLSDAKALRSGGAISERGAARLNETPGEPTCGQTEELVPIRRLHPGVNGARGIADGMDALLGARVSLGSSE